MIVSKDWIPFFPLLYFIIIWYIIKFFCLFFWIFWIYVDLYPLADSFFKSPSLQFLQPDDDDDVALLPGYNREKSKRKDEHRTFRMRRWWWWSGVESSRACCRLSVKLAMPTVTEIRREKRKEQNTCDLFTLEKWKISKTTTSELKWHKNYYIGKVRYV